MLGSLTAARSTQPLGMLFQSSMQRNIVTLFVAISLNLVLLLLQTTFGLQLQVATLNIVWTGLAIVIGFFVGLCAQRFAWGLAAGCCLPMVVYGLWYAPLGTNVTFYILDLLVAGFAAFVVSRFTRQPEIA